MPISPPRSRKSGLGYELVPGPLRLLATTAKDDPEHPYILVIDELNRANLATVFGDRQSGAFLLKFSWTKIVRHVLVKGWASPDDPALTD